MKNLLKWLFTKQQGDEDPIVVEDVEPLSETDIKPLENSQVAQDILSGLNKPEEVKVDVVVEVVKPIEEIKVEVVKPTPPAPLKNYNDGFTSSSSLYGKRR